MKRFISLFLIICLLAVTLCAVTACGEEDGAQAPQTNSEEEKPQENPQNPDENTENPNENGDKEDEMETKTNPKVKITLLDGRTITLELYPDVAPISVANFLKLVDADFYTNTFFHRVIKNFMIQTGWFDISDEGLSFKPNVPTIKGEFAENGVENTLSHTKGVLSMARSQSNDSASGQFFICSADSPHLDGKYAAFGKVVDEASMQVVVDISELPTGNVKFTDYLICENFPIEDNQPKFVVISSITRI